MNLNSYLNNDIIQEYDYYDLGSTERQNFPKYTHNTNFILYSLSAVRDNVLKSLECI